MIAAAIGADVALLRSARKRKAPTAEARRALETLVEERTAPTAHPKATLLGARSLRDLGVLPGSPLRFAADVTPDAVRPPAAR